MNNSNTTTSVARDAGQIETIEGVSRIYRRETIAGLPKATSGSEKYSRSFAQEIFRRHANIHTVEYVTTGRKTESQIVGKRGIKRAPRGTFVRVASTGGKWGKSASNYPPLA